MTAATLADWTTPQPFALPDLGPGVEGPLRDQLETALRQLAADPSVQALVLYSFGEACGYGSRARGDGRADSVVDLLITVPDAWLAQRDRFALLADLWGAVAQPDLSVDLVLHSSSEVARRAKGPGSLVYEAIREGVLLDGQA